jgi:hypothetical protein
MHKGVHDKALLSKIDQLERKNKIRLDENRKMQESLNQALNMMSSIMADVDSSKNRTSTRDTRVWSGSDYTSAMSVQFNPNERFRKDSNDIKPYAVPMLDLLKFDEINSPIKSEPSEDKIGPHMYLSQIEDIRHLSSDSIEPLCDTDEESVELSHSNMKDDKIKRNYNFSSIGEE